MAARNCTTYLKAPGTAARTASQRKKRGVAGGQGSVRRGIGAETRSNLRDAQAAEDRRPILLDVIATSGETKPHPVTTKGIPRGLLGHGEIAICQAFGKQRP